MLRELETALKAAGDPTRARILKLLEAGPLCVCQVQAVLGLAPSTVSKHLTLLKSAGLVADRRDGRWIHYRLSAKGNNPFAHHVLSLLRGPLDRAPRIVEDRRRLRAVKAVPVQVLCALPPARRVPASRQYRAVRRPVRTLEGTGRRRSQARPRKPGRA